MLPTYTCHKKVQAGKIVWIDKGVDCTTLVLTVDGEGTGASTAVSHKYVEKHQPYVGGYYVRYEDGYESFSPSAVFEAGYTKVSKDGLTFGQALEALKAGDKVARAGWNGRGMCLWLMPAAEVKAEWCREPMLKSLAENSGGTVKCLPSIRMLTATGEVLTGWLASQTDLLGSDWHVVT